MSSTYRHRSNPITLPCGRVLKYGRYLESIPVNSDEMKGGDLVRHTEVLKDRHKLLDHPGLMVRLKLYKISLLKVKFIDET